MGSKASYNGVLHLLQTRDIQVRAVVVDSGALPGYKQLEKFHIPDQGRTNLLTKYVWATCGAEPYTELSRNAIEDAYAQITNEARNQYTLGYSPAAHDRQFGLPQSIEVDRAQKRAESCRQRWILRNSDRPLTARALPGISLDGSFGPRGVT